MVVAPRAGKLMPIIGRRAIKALRIGVETPEVGRAGPFEVIRLEADVVVPEQ
jgi:hypothetical protein